MITIYIVRSQQMLINERGDYPTLTPGGIDLVHEIIRGAGRCTCWRITSRDEIKDSDRTVRAFANHLCTLYPGAQQALTLEDARAILQVH